MSRRIRSGDCLHSMTCCYPEVLRTGCCTCSRQKVRSSKTVSIVSWLCINAQMSIVKPKMFCKLAWRPESIKITLIWKFKTSVIATRMTVQQNLTKDITISFSLNGDIGSFMAVQSRRFALLTMFVKTAKRWRPSTNLICISDHRTFCSFMKNKIQSNLWEMLHLLDVMWQSRIRDCSRIRADEKTHRYSIYVIVEASTIDSLYHTIKTMIWMSSVRETFQL